MLLNDIEIIKREKMTAIPYLIVKHYMENTKERISFNEFRDKFNEIKEIFSKNGKMQFLLEEENMTEDTKKSNRKSNYIRKGRSLLEYKYLNTITKFGVLTQWADDGENSNFQKFITVIRKFGYLIEEIKFETEKGKIYMDSDNNVRKLLIDIIQKIIKNQNIKEEDLGINIDEIYSNWFDMALLKNLPESCVGSKNNVRSNQSSIILSGKEFELFPVLRRSEFSEKIIGRHVTIKLPVKIMSNNIKYLKELDLDNENKVIYTYITTNEATSNRIEFGTKTIDGKEYIEFYNSLYKDCKLLVVKMKGKLEYLIFAIKEEDTKEYLGELDLSKAITFFDFKTRITKPEQITYIDKEYIEISKPILGENIIYYGAPGTGKSHTVNEKSKSFDYVERVTFYPEYTHDDFIGCFMPVMNYEKESATKSYVFADGTPSNIKGKPIPYYNFVEGPFTKSLVHALKNPNENVLLIIEELNRANAAAVFGEVFQLLDREYEEQTSYGESKYEISISNEFSEFLASQQIPNYKKGDKIKIPCNLSIYATMNSADQGVNPLDSAFKRRWNFIYFPIDFNNVKYKDYEIDYAGEKVTWKVFAMTINKQLVDKGINEDKYLGQYFITETEIADTYKFASKILLYLYDDVLKFNRRNFFNKNYKTFSELLTGFNNGEKIFDFEFNYISPKEQMEPYNVNENDNINSNIYDEQGEYEDSSRLAGESKDES